MTPHDGPAYVKRVGKLEITVGSSPVRHDNPTTPNVGGRDASRCWDWLRRGRVNIRVTAVARRCNLSPLC